MGNGGFLVWAAAGLGRRCPKLCCKAPSRHNSYCSIYVKAPQTWNASSRHLLTPLGVDTNCSAAAARTTLDCCLALRAQADTAAATHGAASMLKQRRPPGLSHHLHWRTAWTGSSR